TLFLISCNKFFKKYLQLKFYHVVLGTQFVTVDTQFVAVYIQFVATSISNTMVYTKIHNCAREPKRSRRWGNLWIYLLKKPSSYRDESCLPNPHSAAEPIAESIHPIGAVLFIA